MEDISLPGTSDSSLSLSLSRSDMEEEAAQTIQRTWRRFSNRRIYQYFRDLILCRERSDPVLILKSLSPYEASIVDKKSGIFLRFRLGGSSFPPTVYFKCFTKQHITDICSFAPRNYVKERQTKQEHEEEWYMRHENNGWRPISDPVMEDLKNERDEVTERTGEKRRAFHPVRLVRQVDLLRKRKQTKLKWLKKM